MPDDRRDAVGGKTAGEGAEEVKAAESTDEDEEVRFSPEEEAALRAEADEHKTRANALFGRGQFDAALTEYEAGVAVLPIYLHYDRAVLCANMSACHLKTKTWQEAIRHATQAIESLNEADKQDEKDKNEDDDVEEEIISAGAATAAPSPQPLQPAQQRGRLRAKALLRRARARSEAGGWSNLSGAQEDYKALVALPPSTVALSADDRRHVQTQLATLPARVKAAQDKEVKEMWDQLKGLGNGLLRPLGMSLDNFKVTKDKEKDGYNMSFGPKRDQQ